MGLSPDFNDKQNKERYDLIRALSILVARAGGKVIFTEKEVVECFDHGELVMFYDEVKHEAGIELTKYNRTEESDETRESRKLCLDWGDSNSGG